MSIFTYLFRCLAARPKRGGKLTVAEFRAALEKLAGGDDAVGLPGDFNYGRWATPYNLTTAAFVTPAAVVRPATAAEVAAVVKYAADNGFNVQARSGGHSYG